MNYNLDLEISMKTTAHLLVFYCCYSKKQTFFHEKLNRVYLYCTFKLCPCEKLHSERNACKNSEAITLKISKKSFVYDCVSLKAEEWWTV